MNVLIFIIAAFDEDPPRLFTKFMKIIEPRPPPHGCRSSGFQFLRFDVLDSHHYTSS
jgi:hypothetical protein